MALAHECQELIDEARKTAVAAETERCIRVVRAMMVN